MNGREAIVRLLCGALSLGAMSGCDDGSETDHGSTSADATSEQLEWAGFENLEAVEVEGVEVSEGLDQLVAFAVTGSREEIDAVLEAANFQGPLEEGVNVFQPPVDGVVFEDLVAVVSGSETWSNSSGEFMHRKVLRGTTENGEDLLHVWAFTT